MTFDWTTFALQLINVVILLAILRHFLFRPVAGIIAKRQTETDAALKRAQAASDAAKAAEAKARDEAEATIRARHAEMAKVQAEADAARSALLEKARADAAQIVAEGQAARDRQAGIAEARTLERARDLAGTIAGRALAAQPADPSGYAPRLADALAALPAEERDALLAGGNLRLVSAAPLTPEALSAALSALAPFGVTPGTDTDPDLIAGLDLRSDSGVLRNSLRHDLDLITKALRDDRTAA
ncbi:MAG: ATPase [Rhodobacteraceae bacterium]|nr:ATPase [Paracoccaceae bacterium]